MRTELSVIIPTHNRRRLLRRCLDSLCRQIQDPATFEVIVADDGSTDGTAEMVASLRTPFDLRALRLEKVGRPAARNAAIHASQGTACLFIDDDIVASPRLVVEHLKAHPADGNVLAVGRLIQQPPAARDWYAHAFARAWNEHYEELLRRPPAWTDCYGANFSALRSSLIEVGGFASGLPCSEDIELGFRICQAGGVLKYLPRAEAVHDDQKPAARILEDGQRHARGYLEIVSRHPAAESRLLGSFRDAERKEVVLRRILIAVRFPPRPMMLFGRFVPGLGRKMFWLHFVRRFAFWRSVRQQVGRERWRELTHSGAASTGKPSTAQEVS